MESERMRVLRLVQERKITADEAAKLLAVLGEPTEPEDSELAQEETPPALGQEVVRRRSAYWLYITLFGLGWSLIGVGLVVLVKASLWLILVVPFLLIGLLILVVGLWSRSTTWLEIQITDTATGRRKLRLSFPVPLTLAAWGVRMARPFVSQFRETAVDELILAMRDGVNTEGALLVDVVDDDDGERVQVRIG